jgi:hypothetical protein
MKRGQKKVEVSRRAVIARINRALKPDNEQLRITRSERMRQQVGDWYIIDHSRNLMGLADNWSSLDQVARDLGVLKAWEVIEEAA